MAVALIDTSVLVGLADADDQHHHEAVELVKGFDHGELPTARVTNYVVHEMLNWIHSRKRHEKAIETYNRLVASAGFELVHAAQKDFANAVELFETYDGLAFGDATIAAYMRRGDIEYLYSFDDDFDVLDSVTRLETADNPFS